MAEGDLYTTCDNNNLTTEQLLKKTIVEGKIGEPCLKTCSSEGTDIQYINCDNNNLSTEELFKKLFVEDSNGDPCLKVCVSSVPPEPPLELFIPLSWEGDNVIEYDFDIDKDTPSNYNSIGRDTAPQSFDMAIFSKETFSSDDDVYLMGDSIQYSTSNGFFIGYGLKSDIGDNYVDLDFCFWVNGASIIIFESGVNKGTFATLTIGEDWSYRVEYIGSGSVKYYINNILVYTSTTSYSSDTLCVKILGRNPNNALGHHIAFVSGLVPNKYLGGIGDSITFGRAQEGLIKSNYIERTLANLGNSYFSNPLLAVAGSTTQDMINDQLPLLASTYDALRDKNVLNVMGAINDLRTGVPLATIKANLTTIVTTGQAEGFIVPLNTVLPDFNFDWPNRAPLNAWIIANSIGADYVVDHTTSLLETDMSLYEIDMLHPNPDGMQLIADNLSPIINSI